MSEANQLKQSVKELNKQIAKLEEYGGPEEAYSELSRIHQLFDTESGPYEGEESLSMLVDQAIGYSAIQADTIDRLRAERDRLRQQIEATNKRADELKSTLDDIADKCISVGERGTYVPSTMAEEIASKITRLQQQIEADRRNASILQATARTPLSGWQKAEADAEKRRAEGLFNDNSTLRLQLEAERAKVARVRDYCTYRINYSSICREVRAMLEAPDATL